jgi:hypothetical protein
MLIPQAQGKAKSFAFQALRFFLKRSRRVSKSGKLCATLPGLAWVRRLNDAALHTRNNATIARLG